jgi:predicted DNA-binding protein YlxM (UPF0122 family)
MTDVNKTSRHAVVVNGVTYESKKAAAKAHGISNSKLHYRLDNNWTLEQALGLEPSPFDRTRLANGMRRRGYLYSITNKLNGKQYVGITNTTPDVRWKQHRTGLRLDEAPGSIREALFEYSEENFEFKVLLEAYWDELGPLEQKYIAELNTIRPHGYNRTVGGELGGSLGVPVEFHGETFQSLRELCEFHGVSHKNVQQRMKTYNWTLEQALGLEPHPNAVWSLEGEAVILGGVEYSSIAEAARAHDVSASAVYARIANGASIEEAFAEPIVSKKRKDYGELIVDGVTYSSVAALAEAHNLKPATVLARLNAGKSVADAVLPVEDDPHNLLTPEEREERRQRRLTSQRQRRAVAREQAADAAASLIYELDEAIIVGDQTFDSLDQAAEAVGIPIRIVIDRLDKDWPLSLALTKPVSEGLAQGTTITINGVEYPSIAKAADAFKIDPNLVRNRLRWNWTPEQAVGIAPPPNAKDHTVWGDSTENSRRVRVGDKIYETLREAAEDFNISYRTVYDRIEHGWDILKALTTPVKEVENNIPVTVNGQTFNSIAEAANALGIKKVTVYARLRKGQSIEQAFAPVRKYNG